MGGGARHDAALAGAPAGVAHEVWSHGLGDFLLARNPPSSSLCMPPGTVSACIEMLAMAARHHLSHRSPTSAAGHHLIHLPSLQAAGCCRQPTAGCRHPVLGSPLCQLLQHGEGQGRAGLRQALASRHNLQHHCGQPAGWLTGLDGKRVNDFLEA